MAGLYTNQHRFTPGQRSVVMGMLQGIYDHFVERVATGRGRSRKEIRAIAEGRIWTGRQGLDNGLVDKLGDLHLAVETARTAPNVQF